MINVKFAFVFFMVFTMLFHSLCVFSEGNGHSEVQNKYLQEIEEKGYSEQVEKNNFNIIEIITREFKTILTDFVDDEFKKAYSVLILQIMIAVLIMITNGGINSGIVNYSGCIICSVYAIDFFVNNAKICRESIYNIIDFIKVTIPTYFALLADCGYVTTYATLNTVFIGVSYFLSEIVCRIILPVLYYCGIICIVDNLFDYVNFNGFIETIKKSVKYLIGFVLTLFASAITLTGLTSVTSDNVMIRTAKYAVSNFVPVVGAFLSESVNTMVNSSVVLKNNIGISGFIVVITMCIKPLVEVGMNIIMFKMMSFVMNMITTNNMGRILESTTDILEIMLGVFIVIIFMFMLFVTVVVSVGV